MTMTFHKGQKVIEINYQGEAIVKEKKEVVDPSDPFKRIFIYRIEPIGWELPDFDDGWCEADDLAQAE